MSCWTRLARAAPAYMILWPSPSQCRALPMIAKRLGIVIRLTKCFHIDDAARRTPCRKVPAWLSNG